MYKLKLRGNKMKNVLIFLRNALLTPVILVRLILSIVGLMVEAIGYGVQVVTDFIPGYYKRFKKWTIQK